MSIPSKGNFPYLRGTPFSNRQKAIDPVDASMPNTLPAFGFAKLANDILDVSFRYV
jgi:hypothetical protein